MRNPTTQKGFTLIELLIVIAIIGILAAVLVPNLLNARTQAQQRAAQSYSSQVFTASMAVLASGSQLTPSEVADAVNALCDEDAGPVDTITVEGTIYNYGFPAAPAVVTSCTVTGDDTTGTITVRVETAIDDFENGAVVPDPS